MKERVSDSELMAREARRAARANAEVRIFGPGEEEAIADADALFWDRIPKDERANFVWQLSLEAFSLGNPEVTYEPRLSELTQLRVATSLVGWACCLPRFQSPRRDE